MNNQSFYAPFSTWGDSLESWMGLNDVNILDISEDHILYEYAYLSNGRKWWAKTFFLREPNMLPTSELPYIIRSVEDVRRVADIRGRANGEQ